MNNKYRAVMSNGIVMENNTLRGLYESARLNLRMASYNCEHLDVKFYEYNRRREEYEYMGIGSAIPGTVYICGQFTRTDKNYYNNRAVITYRRGWK